MDKEHNSFACVGSDPFARVGLGSAVFGLSLCLMWPPPELMRAQYTDLCEAIDALEPGIVRFHPFDTLHSDAATLANYKYFVDKLDRNLRTIKAREDDLARLDVEFGHAAERAATIQAEHKHCVESILDVVDCIQGITLPYVVHLVVACAAASCAAADNVFLPTKFYYY
jgi:hypothetical protein